MGRAAAEFGDLEPMSLLHKLSEATAQGQQVHEFKPKSLIQLPLATVQETDGPIAPEGGLYGHGVYFTDHSCNGLHYSGGPQPGLQRAGCTTMPFTAVMRAVVLG